jgi:hypothetical protein
LSFYVNAYSGIAKGVYFASATTGDININGIFTIQSKNCCGVYFVSAATDSNIVIDGIFGIYSSDGYAVGVCFDSTDVDSTQTINGTFKIYSYALQAGGKSSSEVCGVLFTSITRGFITINGAFKISSSSSDLSDLVYGVHFNDDIFGNVTINGIFAISSFCSSTIFGPTSSASGVTFNSSVNSNVVIDATFAIFSSSVSSDVSTNACGIIFNDSSVTGDITIKGTFTISSTSLSYADARGVDLHETAIGSIQIIDGIFTISSSNSAYGVFSEFTNYDDSNIAIGGSFAFSALDCYSINFSNRFDYGNTISMTSAQFFSNSVDLGNIFMNCSTDQN